MERSAGDLQRRRLTTDFTDKTDNSDKKVLIYGQVLSVSLSSEISLFKKSYG
jgi:hypothetical protein